MSEPVVPSRRRDINAILLAVYLWMFTILRVAWAFQPRYSTEILAAAALVIVATSLLSTGSRVSRSESWAVALILVVLASILLDMLFRNNAVLGQRLYEFMIYAAIPVFLLSRVRDLEQFLRVYVAVSLVVFLVYVLDPLNRYLFSQSYMVYGFQAMLPTFFGIHVGRRQFGIRLLGLPEIICFVMMALFGNRMAAVAGLFFIIVYELAFGRSSRMRLARYTGFVGLAAIIVANLDTLVSTFAAGVKARGYSSYSLNAALYYLTGSLSSLTAGRDALWASALAFIAQRPILGYGLGYFESVEGIYPHNFVLELLVSYGVVGLLIYAVGLLNGVVQIVRSQGLLRLLGVLLFCTSFPKLLTSIYVFVEPTFWMLIFYGVFAPIYRLRQLRVSGQVIPLAPSPEQTPA